MTQTLTLRPPATFALTSSAHGDECPECLQAAQSARSMARVTGSTKSGYDDGRGHTATVARQD